MALVKHNNNSISAVTSMASLSTGSMTLIKEQTASSSASISFVDGSSDVVLDSTYPIYKFEFINIHPATDEINFVFNLSTDAGSNYNVTKTTTMISSYHNEGDTDQNVQYMPNQDLAQSTSDQIITLRIGNDNDQCVSGTMMLFNPSSTTFVKHFLLDVNVTSFNNYSEQYLIAGYGNTTSAVDGIKFLMSSGNIDSGTIKLYGIKDS